VAPDLPDLNVWLALAWPGHPHHSRAAAYWEQMASSQVLFCTVTVLGLLRLLSPIPTWQRWRLPTVGGL
jgi:predicted nucleic acid-binding protein